MFTCSVRAYGILSFVWKRLNSNLPKKHFIEVKSSLNGTTSFLFIPNVTRGDIGKYYCDVWANNKASRSNVVRLQFSGTYITKFIRTNVHMYICSYVCN